MDNKGQEIIKVFHYVQQVFEECQKIFLKIDNLMAPEWRSVYGNRITKDTSASLLNPEMWLPEAIFRTYESEDRLVNKCVTISFWSDGIDEPIITVGKISYNDINQRGYWDLWRAWFEWEGNSDNKQRLDGSINQFKPKENEGIKEVKIFSLPLISITNDIELETKIVKPLKGL